MKFRKAVQAETRKITPARYRAINRSGSHKQGSPFNEACRHYIAVNIVDGIYL